MKEKTTDNRPPAPVKFIGIQQGFAHIAPVALFNVTTDKRVVQPFALASLAARSTVTQRTIEAAGFRVPDAELELAKAALLNYIAQRREMYKEVA